MRRNALLEYLSKMPEKQNKMKHQSEEFKSEEKEKKNSKSFCVAKTN